MKCAESLKLWQVFANVVSVGITKGMSEGLEYGVKQGEAKLDLATIEAYTPDADDKYIAALHALKDLKYPLRYRRRRSIMDPGASPQLFPDHNTCIPRGLAVLLADMAIQTEDEVSPRLIRSKPLPPMYHLDWP
ncbi:hypothetical protein Tco_1369116 [Tanacetum coccineum]